MAEDQEDLHPDIALHMRTIRRALDELKVEELTRVRAYVMAAVLAHANNEGKSGDPVDRMLKSFAMVAAQGRNERRRVDEGADLVADVERYLRDEA